MAKVPDPLEKATAAPVAFFKAEESVFFRKSHSPEQHAGNESGELAFFKREKPLFFAKACLQAACRQRVRKDGLYDWRQAAS